MGVTEFLPGVPDYSTAHEPVGDLFQLVTSRSDWVPMKLSEAQIDQFWRDGFLLNIPVLSHEQCDKVLDDYKYFLGQESHPGMKMLYEYHSNQSGDPNNVLMHALGHWRLTKHFHDLIYLPQVVVPSSQLLEQGRMSSVRFWHDQLFAKPPKHGGNVAWSDSSRRAAVLNYFKDGGEKMEGQFFPLVFDPVCMEQ
ncbi:hypothetical protein MAR_019666 [Mya arenaria]|uniref:Uncharacterized protein n=1 Tax=Mya arenaria TaxID=6604 RepID=A0ABY7E2Q1_MYAAR|nr:hypothetical protein MAR_019666 [Mya arenaria]